MVYIKIKKGLDIPIEGGPVGEIRALPSSDIACLDFTPFRLIHSHLLVKAGDEVAIGQPLIEDKKNAGRFWVSPASGNIREILRGPKRVLEGILIERDSKNRHWEFPSQENIIPYLCQTGLINQFWMRPFHIPVQPHLLPRSIFVKGLESAPFTPPAEMQIAGYEAEFQAGLSYISDIAPIHLVSRKGFGEFIDVTHHIAEGPHPISSPSLHIQLIDPIRNPSDVIWTIDSWGVVAIGFALKNKRMLTDRVIALAGTGFQPELRGYYRAEIGRPLDFSTASSRIISGDPLMGEQRSYLGFFHSVCTALAVSNEREPLHFLRVWSKYFTASKAYGSCKKIFPFTTHLHGEERAFIDENIYDRVMPLHVPTALLVKAVIAEDLERAEALGILEVAPEDFALPTFICPSKIEMVEIIENGLRRFAVEMLSI